MKNKLISIVLPIYNVEKYLIDCIESVINQSYRNIEIILVDDGSSDRSGAICDEYKDKDSRIKVIHKENGGLSDARNSGLKISTGEYITFIDSDDCIGLNYIDILVKMIEKYDAEIAICNYNHVEESFSFNHEKSTDNTSMIYEYNNIECIKNMYLANKQGLEFLAWGKLYSKKLFTENGIIYPKGKIHEDTFTTYKVIYNAKKIVFNDTKLYFYRKRNGSIMNSQFSIKFLNKLEAIEETCEFFENKSEIDLLQLAFNDYMKIAMKLYHKLEISYIEKDKKNLKKQLIKKTKTIYAYYIKKIKYPMKKKIYYCIILNISDIFRRYILRILN